MGRVANHHRDPQKERIHSRLKLTGENLSACGGNHVAREARNRHFRKKKHFRPWGDEVY